MIFPVALQAFQAISRRHFKFINRPNSVNLIQLSARAGFIRWVGMNSVEPGWFFLHNPWIHTIAATSSFFLHIFLYIVFHMKNGATGTVGVLALTAMWFVATGGVPLGALGFEEIVAGIGEVAEVRSARLERVAGEQELLSASYPGDVRFGFTPSATMVTEEGSSFSDRTTVGAAASVDIPIGLSRDRRVVSESRAADLIRAQDAEGYAFAAAYADLLVLYRAAWLAQEELVVLEGEYAAAEELARVARERFERGNVSLREVQAAEDDLVEAQSDLRAGVLARRLGALELLYAAGLEEYRVGWKDAELDPPPAVLPDIPRPPELTAWAVRNDPGIRALWDEIGANGRAVQALDGPVGAPVIRTGFSGYDQTASVAFNTADPTVSLSYGASLVTIGSISDTSSTDGRGGSGDVDTWEVSFSLALPLRTTRTDRLTSDLLDTRSSLVAVRLEESERDLALAIRSRYQQYELAGEAIRDARRSAEITEGILKTVQDRYATNRATTGDLLLAEAQHRRGLYRIDAALAAQEEAKILTAAAASYLQELMGSLPEMAKGTTVK